MEWAYAILIAAFLYWSVQIVLGYMRQSALLEAEIKHARSVRQELDLQSERCEQEGSGKNAELKDQEQKVKDLEKKEKELQGSIRLLKQQEAAGRAMRSHVAKPDPPTGNG